MSMYGNQINLDWQIDKVNLSLHYEDLMHMGKKIS